MDPQVLGIIGAGTGVLGTIAFVALGAAAVKALRQPHRHAAMSGVPAGDAALATLRARLARGEIDRAEYEERRAALLEEGVRWP